MSNTEDYHYRDGELSELKQDLQDVYCEQWKRLQNGINVRVSKKGFRSFSAKITIDGYANSVAKQHLVITLSEEEGGTLARATHVGIQDRIRHFREKTPYSCAIIDSNTMRIPMPPQLPPLQKMRNCERHCVGMFETHVQETVYAALKHLFLREGVCEELRAMIKDHVTAICLQQVTYVAYKEICTIERREFQRLQKRRQQE